ncbi:MAG: hydrogenase maturation nickel metallochaperone HypA [bacterium]
MHELSIAQALIEQVEGRLAGKPAASVCSVTIRIGDLSGVSPDALEAAFQVASDGTRLAAAKLVIERVPALGTCQGCRRETSLEFPFHVCGHCGSTDVLILRGREMDLVSFDIEETTPMPDEPADPAGRR